MEKQGLYVPELPLDKENGSKPRYKELSSKSTLTQAPRFALGSLSNLENHPFSNKASIHGGNLKKMNTQNNNNLQSKSLSIHEKKEERKGFEQFDLKKVPTLQTSLKLNHGSIQTDTKPVSKIGGFEGKKEEKVKSLLSKDIIPSLNTKGLQQNNGRSLNVPSSMKEWNSGRMDLRGHLSEFTKTNVEEVKSSPNLKENDKMKILMMKKDENVPSVVQMKTVSPKIASSPENKQIEENPQNENQEAENLRKEQENRELKEEEERESRRKQKREDESLKKGSELVNRARDLEKDGKTAAAIALFKEALFYLPNNEKLKSRIEKLRDQLRGAFTASEEPGKDQEDPIENLFEAKLTVQTNIQQLEENHKQTKENESSEEEIREPVVVSSNTHEILLVKLNKIMSDTTKTKQQQKALGSIIRLVQHYFEIEKLQKNTEDCEPKKKVSFHRLDCAIEPPPQKCADMENDDFEHSLYPVDRAIDELSNICKAGDEIRKTLSKNSNLDFDALINEVKEVIVGYEYSNFMSCSIQFASGKTKCDCFSETRKNCVYKAINPKDRLSQMISTGLRSCLRRVFNNGKLFVQPGTGSYRYAIDDVASVMHRALLLFDTTLPLVDSFVLMGKTKSNKGEDDQIARIGEFVEAHKFLIAMFPNEIACQELVDSDSVCWAKIRKYLSIARDYRCEDELVLAPLASLSDLVKKLKDHSNLVSAARGQVELAFRQAMQQDTCGQCNCEGARRRRAQSLGTWMAPTLISQSSNSTQIGTKCGECSKFVAEKSEQISCECCQKVYHLSCVSLPNGFNSDYVCSKCVPKYKNNRPSTSSTTKEDEEE